MTLLASPAGAPPACCREPRRLRCPSQRRLRFRLQSRHQWVPRLRLSGRSRPRPRPVPAQGPSLPVASSALDSATGAGRLSTSRARSHPGAGPGRSRPARRAVGPGLRPPRRASPPVALPLLRGAREPIPAWVPRRAHGATGHRGVPSPDDESAATPATAGSSDAVPVAGSVPDAIRSAGPRVDGAADAASTPRQARPGSPARRPGSSPRAPCRGGAIARQLRRGTVARLSRPDRSRPRTGGSSRGFLGWGSARLPRSAPCARALAKGTEHGSYDARRCPSRRRSSSQ